MRYFAELSYNGTRLHGWQRQPNAASVQAAIEEAFSTILRTNIEVVGCGRTDTGVHAKQYFLHFDFDQAFPPNFVFRLNKFLSSDISIHGILEVPSEAHARFDASSRSYAYHIISQKSPFKAETAWYYANLPKLDFDLMQKAAGLLLQYDEFFPFCKTHSDVKTMRCQLKHCEWQKVNENHWCFHIQSDRFLRGMVRLIVGMCFNVGQGKTNLDAVKKAMDEQSQLIHSYSVPAQGLFLTDIEYPFLAK